MVKKARVRLIVAVGGVMGAVLLAVGALVFAIMNHQLNATVDLQLRRADTGLLQLVGRPILALQQGGVPNLPNPKPGPVDPPPSAGDSSGASQVGYAPLTVGFTKGITIGSAGQPLKVDPSVDAAGAFTTESVDGSVQAVSGSVPSGLPDRQALAAARPGHDDLRTVTVNGHRFRILTRVLESNAVLLPPAAIAGFVTSSAAPGGVPPPNFVEQSAPAADVPPTIVQSGVSLGARDRQQRILLLGLSGGGLLGLALTIAGTVFLSGRALAPLQVAFERQRRFIGDASHELRTPLALVRMEAEALAADFSDPGLARPLIRQVDRTTRLATELLAIARLEHGVSALNREPIHVQSLLRTASLAAQRLAAPGVIIKLEAPDSLWINGDRDGLYQVLLNLVDNACRVTQTPGKVRLTANSEAGRVAITVSDDGPGIPPECLPHIFEPFYRIDQARSRVAGGTGLGLTIAREIVRTHGGEIRLKSPASGGVTVTMWLDVAPTPSPILSEAMDVASI